MIRTIIIEDEYFGQELLKKHIHKHFPNLLIVGVTGAVDNAIEMIHAQKPDLVLLDIQLMGGTGFDVLKGIRIRNFELIFITAYNQYAIEAIRNDARDYILKPIKIHELETAIKKCVDQIKIKNQNGKENTFTVNTPIGTEYISEDSILYFEAEGTYTNVVCEHKKVYSSKNLGEYEKLLDPQLFFRTHHSYIINCKKIRKFEKGRSGKLVMSNGNEIPVSQRKMKEFSNFLLAITG